MADIPTEIFELHGADNSVFKMRGEVHGEWAIHPVVTMHEGELHVVLNAFGISSVVQGASAGWCESLVGARKIARAIPKAKSITQIFHRMGGSRDLERIPMRYMATLKDWNAETTSLAELEAEIYMQRRSLTQ